MKCCHPNPPWQEERGEQGVEAVEEEAAVTGGGVPEPDQEEEADPEPVSVSEYQSPVHEPRRRPMVHLSAQAPLPKDYGRCSAALAALINSQ